MSDSGPLDIDPYANTVRFSTDESTGVANAPWDSDADGASVAWLATSEVLTTNGNGNKPKAPLLRPSTRIIRPIAQGGADADYLLMSVLGQGGMAVVHEAYQMCLSRTVAVKLIRQRFAVTESFKSRFLQEAATVASLEHPNIIPIYDLGVDQDGQLFYAMKRVTGTPWKDSIGSNSLEKNIRILMDVADAVAFAHRHGVVHRDLKPANVLIGEYGEVTVIDWGLAVGWLPDSPAPPREGASNAGTPAYMAPEMAVGDVALVGPRTDVYLLGAILYEILAGAPPHFGVTLRETLRMAADNVWNDAGLDGELGEICHKALATDPEDRFADVKEMQTAMRGWFGHSRSERLRLRGSDLAGEARRTKQYDLFARAEFALEEALNAWPDNRQARRELGKLRQEFALTAAEHGDYDYALFLLDSQDPENQQIVNSIKQMKSVRRRLHDEATSAKVETEKWRQAFVSSPDVKVIFGLTDLRIMETNALLDEITGVSSGCLVGRPLSDVIIDDAAWSDALQELRSAGFVSNHLVSINGCKGHRVPLLFSGRKYHAEGSGEVVVGTMTDVSTALHPRSEVRLLEARLRDVLKQAHVGTYELDPVTSRLFLGYEALRILGSSAEGISTDQDFLRMLEPRDREPLMKAWRQALEHGTPFELVVELAQPRCCSLRITGKALREHDATVEILGSLAEVTYLGSAPTKSRS